MPWGWDFTGATSLPLLGQSLRSHFMVRRIKSDVLPQLPPRYTPSVVYAKPNTPAKDALSRIEAYDEDTIKRQTANAEFHEISKARRELGLSKVPFVVSYCKELLDAGHDSILLFAHHKEVIDDLKASFDAMKVSCLTFTGGLSAQEKDDRVTRFQNKSGKIKIFIVSIGAGGVGITLTKSSYIVFGEYSWVSTENEQAIDRAHRIGQESGVCIDYIVYEGTLDERILKKGFIKQGIIDATMGE